MSKSEGNENDDLRRKLFAQTDLPAFVLDMLARHDERLEALTPRCEDTSPPERKFAVWANLYRTSEEAHQNAGRSCIACREIEW